MFVKPDYLVLFDDIVAVRPEKFTWMFHGEGGNSIRAEEACVRVVRPKAELRMDVLQPEGISYSLKPYPDRDASFIAVRTPGSSRSVRFLSVLIPMSAENRQEREGWKSAESRRETGWEPKCAGGYASIPCFFERRQAGRWNPSDGGPPMRTGSRSPSRARGR